MPILEFMVSEPPTSAELEAQALLSVSSEDVATRGLLQLVVRAEREIPHPTNETLTVRIRRKEYAQDGGITSILGSGSMNIGTDASFESDSVVITLAGNKEYPAHARVVTP